MDVSFSIDDLAAKTVPEPWDGGFYLCACTLGDMKNADQFRDPELRGYVFETQIESTFWGELGPRRTGGTVVGFPMQSQLC